MVYGLLRELEHLVYPPVCLLCGGPGLSAEEPMDLCLPCYRGLPAIGFPCERCGLPLPSPALSLCGRCTVNPPVNSGACMPYAYTGQIAELIRRLKFGGNQVCGRTLGLLLADAVAARSAALPEALVPVPLYPSRHAERGFNQAAEIAAPVSARLGLPVVARGLRRTRPTLEQTGLSARVRKRNVQGAFRAAGLGGLRHVALIDDVVTTGSTARAACGALLGAGAQRVDIWAVARTAAQRSVSPGYPALHWVV